MVTGIFKDLRRSVKDRGWNPVVGLVRLVIRYIFKGYILTSLARCAPYGLVPVLHKLRGVKMGKQVFIDRTAIIDEAYPEKVIIEDDVRITAGAVIMAHMKASYFLRDNFIPFEVKQTKICKYSLIGLNAVIMPGVTVGEGAVVASGSVVIFDVPPYTIVRGNPAKEVKRLK